MELRAIAEPIIGAEAAAELKGIQTLAGSIGHNVSLAGEARAMCARSTARVAKPAPLTRATSVTMCRA